MSTKGDALPSREISILVILKLLKFMEDRLWIIALRFIRASLCFRLVRSFSFNN